MHNIRCGSGFSKQFVSEKLEPWETYVFRLRFVQPDSSLSEWSPEISITTSSELNAPVLVGSIQCGCFT